MISTDNVRFIHSATREILDGSPLRTISNASMVYISRGTILPAPLLISTITRELSNRVVYKIADKQKQTPMSGYMTDFVVSANFFLQVPIYFALATLSFKVQVAALGILLGTLVIANLLSKKELDAIVRRENTVSTVTNLTNQK